MKRDSSASSKLLATRSSEGPGKASDIFDHQKGTISGTEEKEGSWWSIDLGPSFRLAKFTAPPPFYTGTWSVGGEVGAFRYFQIFQTGRNSSHKYGIYLSGIELFGMLLYI